jgi:hypothetical protein
MRGKWLGVESRSRLATMDYERREYTSSKGGTGRSGHGVFGSVVAQSNEQDRQTMY